MSNTYLEKLSEKKSSKLKTGLAATAGLVAGAVAGKAAGAKLGAKMAIKGFKNIKAGGNPAETIKNATDGVTKAYRTATNVMRGGIVAGGAAGAGAAGAVVHKYSGQEKKAAFDALVEHGMNYDEAVAAIEKEAGDKLRGLVSPAWMEQSIAHKHGQKGNETLGGQYASHVGGTQRAALRSGAETVVGGATGLGVGALADKLLAKRTKGMAAPVLGIAGAVAGNIHGVYKSLKNQQGEMHAKYSGQEKKAAFDALVEQGMNYDEAVAAIEKEAGIASVVGSMARKVMASPTVGKAVNMAVKNPMRTAMGAGALATGAGALMARGSREKQACVQMLMEQGVNFEEAVEMTKQASQELYGE